MLFGDLISKAISKAIKSFFNIPKDIILETSSKQYWGGETPDLDAITGENKETYNEKYKKQDFSDKELISYELGYDFFEENNIPDNVACTEWEDLSFHQIFSKILKEEKNIHNTKNQLIFSGKPLSSWSDLEKQQIFDEIIREGYEFVAIDTPEPVTISFDFISQVDYAHLDYDPCRLPLLSQTQLSDPEKGIWELWGEDPARLKAQNLVGRDPGLDVHKNRVVAIDFGTSSTVVAMEMANGSSQLLRIGARDFFQAPKAQDFENPTVLECVDYPAFHKAWTAKAYRPDLDWDWMRASHEAREHFRENPGDTRILSSIFPLLKQWALRTQAQRRRLTDQQPEPCETEIAPHTERNPARGQALQASPADVFDPIELYAWYLGMAINWRERGLFLKYNLSFPVKYPSDVKQRILASFRLGLQRSLPESLIKHHPEVLNEFEVTELASEPMAYAAAALPHLGIEPSEEGVPYAVFDFGGGTSDFDYGLLRWATEDEEDATGCERVMEQLANSGDNFLGGENLLEHLVYESFKGNLDTLRTNRIQFTQPIDAQPFPGSEAFLARSQAAQTNTIMLSDKLRPFLESSTPKLNSAIKLDLLDADGQKQTSELKLDQPMLDAMLSQRIHQGVQAFVQELARIHPKFPKHAPIHVLLAGNGSRSRHIKTFFDTSSAIWQELLKQTWKDVDPPKIEVHPPLPMNEQNPQAPTAKTGVALGLLGLAEGQGVLVKKPLHDVHGGEAPFTWSVGRMRRGTFDTRLAPHTAYNDWQELGPLQQGVFNLYATTSPRASMLKDGDAELLKHRLAFRDAPEGAKAYVRATKPNTLEVAAAVSRDALGETTLQEIALD